MAKDLRSIGDLRGQRDEDVLVEVDARLLERFALGPRSRLGGGCGVAWGAAPFRFAPGVPFGPVRCVPIPNPGQL